MQTRIAFRCRAEPKLAEPTLVNPNARRYSPPLNFELTIRTYARRISQDQSRPLRRSRLEEPTRLQTLQPQRTRRGQNHAGASPLFGGVLAHDAWDGRGHVWRRHHEASVGGWHQLSEDGAQAGARDVRILRKARRSLLRVP